MQLSLKKSETMLPVKEMMDVLVNSAPANFGGIL